MITNALTMKAMNAAVSAGLIALLASGCSPNDGETATSSSSIQTTKTEVDQAAPRLIVTHDGGVEVLDATDLSKIGGVDAQSRTTLAVAGDQRHVYLIETERGVVRILDSGTWTDSHGDHTHFYVGQPAAEPAEIAGNEPGHVVPYGGRAAIFNDGSGTIDVLDEADLSAAQPKSVSFDQLPHHGVAIPLEGGRVLTSIPGPGEGNRLGIAILDPSGVESARFEECDAIHGETHVNAAVFAFGCTDGVLIYDDATKSVRKVASPVPNGRVSTLVGSTESSVVLGNYAIANDDTSLSKVTLSDSDGGAVRVVDIGAKYHGLARGPHGEALVLATDGRLHVIDPSSGEIVRRIDVVAPWEKPADYKVPRPELAVAGTDVWVTDPATSSIFRLDLETGTVDPPVAIGVRMDKIAVVGA